MTLEQRRALLEWKQDYLRGPLNFLVLHLMTVLGREIEYRERKLVDFVKLEMSGYLAGLGLNAIKIKVELTEQDKSVEGLDQFLITVNLRGSYPFDDESFTSIFNHWYAKGFNKISRKNDNRIILETPIFLEL